MTDIPVTKSKKHPPARPAKTYPNPPGPFRFGAIQPGTAEHADLIRSADFGTEEARLAAQPEGEH